MDIEKSPVRDVPSGQEFIFPCGFLSSWVVAYSESDFLFSSFNAAPFSRRPLCPLPIGPNQVSRAWPF